MIDVLLHLQQCLPLASYQMYFAVPIGWLARLGLWWGALRQRIVVFRGEPTSTDDEFTIDDRDATNQRGQPVRQIYQATALRLIGLRRLRPSSRHHKAPGAVIAQRPRNRTSTAASRQRRRIFHGPGPCPGTTEVLTALARAWQVTTIATALLLATLAIAPIWDRAIFMQALRDALSGDPQLTQPVDEAPANAAGRVSRQSSTGFLLVRPQ